MKKLLYLTTLVCAMMFTACSKDSIEVEKNEELHLLKVRMSMDESYAPITRGVVTDIKTVVAHAGIWARNTNTGAIVKDTKSSSEDGFGTASLELPFGLYSITAYGATTKPTIDNNNIMSFTNNIIGDVFYGKVNSVSSSVEGAVIVDMKRIIGRFKLVLTDASVPATVKKMQFTHTGYTKFKIVQGIPDPTSNGPTTISLNSTTNNKEYYFNIFSTEEESSNQADAQKINVLVEALDANNAVLGTYTFTNVPIRNNYVTTYTGAMFGSNTAGFTLTINNDWGEGYNINF